MAESTKTEGRELVITRVFDAPRERVWRAWADAEQVKKWWGPKIFTAPTVQIDFREGGKFFLGMQSPDWNDGKEIFDTGTYKEIVHLEKIVYLDSFADGEGNPVPATYYGLSDKFPKQMVVTVTFEDAPGGKTKLTLRHAGFPAGEDIGAEQGWSESLDKMAASLV